MKRFSAMLVIAIFALGAISCGDTKETTTNDTNVAQDKGTVTDKGPGTDQGSQNLAVVGDKCEDGTDCNTGFCLTTDTLTSLLASKETLEVPDGYCTKLLCGSNDECGKAAKCVDLNGFDLKNTVACFATCDPEKTDSCRKDYTCFADPRIKDKDGTAGFAVCIPDSLIGLLPALNAEGASSE